MTVWTDATSYSQGQRGNIEPHSWSTIVGETRIYITRNHIYYRGTWIVVCRSVDVDNVPLGSADELSLEGAQQMALETVQAHALEKSNRFMALFKLLELAK